jgi:hypothetical protein
VGKLADQFELRREGYRKHIPFYLERHADLTQCSVVGKVGPIGVVASEVIEVRFKLNSEDRASKEYSLILERCVKHECLKGLERCCRSSGFRVQKDEGPIGPRRRWYRRNIPSIPWVVKSPERNKKISHSRSINRKKGQS